ncbi:hypothetical protein CERZMDRAFT_80182 [Cercospora zeae-maydis SCOH1-5]|uniref:Uncharacterized protein n=1 Tax=Cercospora zeae-maydis SCOH1-5 TaxID=717836 RepID=A0A6A6FW03_9PEZI|nr:hypothetical protein CERZMDRAFT_80182 [Cercospora zeae-maydis SCOH1-5]
MPECEFRSASAQRLAVFFLKEYSHAIPRRDFLSQEAKVSEKGEVGASKSRLETVARWFEALALFSGDGLLHGAAFASNDMHATNPSEGGGNTGAAIRALFQSHMGCMHIIIIQNQAGCWHDACTETILELQQTGWQRPTNTRRPRTDAGRGT